MHLNLPLRLFKSVAETRLSGSYIVSSIAELNVAEINGS